MSPQAPPSNYSIRPMTRIEPDLVMDRGTAERWNPGRHNAEYPTPTFPFTKTNLVLFLTESAFGAKLQRRSLLKLSKKVSLDHFYPDICVHHSGQNNV